MMSNEAVYSTYALLKCIVFKHLSQVKIMLCMCFILMYIE